MKIQKRLLHLTLPHNKSAFLWGPRKTGKSFWIRQHMPDAIVIDLLKTDVFADYVSRPALLRERYAETTKRIVIDEVQKVPSLLDEVHWLIENKNSAFLLTGSSARKLKRGQANLLGGRAWRYTMAPLCYPEIADFDIEHIMTSGLLPPHFMSGDPIQDLRAYIADYLKEEIASEALVQNIPAFAEFLKIAALTCGELLNYTNIARETGVSAKVVRSYFQILEDTLLGFRLQPWKKSQNRKLVETEKFYLFDVGVSNYLAKRKPKFQTREFGKSFEHYLLMELKAYQAYQNPELSLHYWRTSNNQEVDFILGEMEVALEVKAANRVNEFDTKHLQCLSESHTLKQKLLISFEKESKQFSNGVKCLHWETFLKMLWSNQII
jgi:uncharacterized protein